MIKYKPIPEIKLNGTQEEILFFNPWLFDSHYWIDENYYYKCKWCLDTAGKNFGITSEKIIWELCPNNPYIKKKGERP